MAVRFYTSDPGALLEAIYKGIDSGHVATWAYDTDGDFSHSPDQWKGLAWLKPSVETDNLLLTILPPQGKNVSVLAYAVYHGRFVEMVLNHFDKLFSASYVSALAMPIFGDVLTGNS
jgi:hypothetical protein